MTFPLSIFLYVYIAFVAIWALFSLVGVYHIVKFSQIGFTSVMSVIVYAGGSLAILNVSYLLIGQIDWEMPINILSGLFKMSL